ELRNESRGEYLEAVRKFSVRQPVSFKCASERGLIGAGLACGSSERQALQGWQEQRCDELMVQDTVEGFPNRPSGNLPLQLFAICFALFWKDSSFLRIECAREHCFVEAHVIPLLQIIPAVRRDSGKQIGGCAPKRGGTRFIDQ